MNAWSARSTAAPYRLYWEPFRAGAGVGLMAPIGVTVFFKAVTLFTYVLSGTMAGLTGCVLMSRLVTAQPNEGVMYELDAIASAVIGGTSLMGGVGTISGTIIGAFVIDKKFTEASYFAAAGAVLTFFGFMHGEQVGIAVTPTVAAAYVIVAGFLYALSRAPAFEFSSSPTEEAHSPVPAE